MTIIFSNHQLKYQIESLCKLFFPCTKFTLLYEAVKIEDDTIFTRVKKGKKNTYLSVIIKINGEILRKQSCVLNKTDAYKRECERLFSIMIYKLLSNALNIYPKWGISTGVRPVTVARKLIAKGYDYDQLKSHFVSDYLVDESKLSLMLDTIKNQTDILKMNTDNSYSL
ncbi:MAG: hypothetical protein RR497_04930, partial [Oscillospiraceae bacterium]